MKIIKLIIQSVVLFIFITCTARTERDLDSSIKKISIDITQNKILKLSDFADSIEIIPLETTDQNLIAEIRRIIVHNERYYIRSTRGWQDGKLFVFDKQGKFLFRIGTKGQGPGQYIDFRDFAITNDQVKLISYGKILNYGLDGTYINEKKLDIVAKAFCSLNENENIFYGYEAYKRNNHLLSIFDIAGTHVQDIMKVESAEVAKSEANFNQNALEADGDICYFNYPYCDTIYGITNRIAYPIYYVDYGNKKLPPDIYEAKDDAMKMEEKRKRFGYYCTLYAMGFGEHFVFIGSGDSERNSYISLYSKETGIVLTGQRIMDDMYFIGNVIKLRNTIISVMPSNAIGEYLLCQIEPDKLLDAYNQYKMKLSTEEWDKFCKKYPHLIDICANMQEDDNPLLLKIRVKKFN
jgi:hypothetical protein